MEPGIKHETDNCHAVADVLARIGDKWTVYVVRLLSNGPMRFNEIRRAVGGISQRMLTLTLRGLERDGLVTRRGRRGRCSQKPSKSMSRSPAIGFAFVRRKCLR